jgi:hypothetical protein
MALLQEAKARGYHKVTELQKDKWFDPLRSRTDFQALLGEGPDPR